MRGSPLLTALAAFLGIALLGFPLWRLTRAQSEASILATPPAPETETKAEAHFEMDFTLPPESVMVDHLGRMLWSADRPGMTIEHDAELPWPKEGIDLRVRVNWPSGASMAAVRLRITDANGVEHEQSVFSRGPADEVLTFK